MTSEENTNEDLSIKNENILNHTLNKEMKTSYINYAMSVIIGRALPDVRDGLKPGTDVCSMGCMREATLLIGNTVNLRVQ